MTLNEVVNIGAKEKFYSALFDMMMIEMIVSQHAWFVCERHQ